MKSTLCLIAFMTLTSALTGCMVEPESTPEPSETSQSDVSSDEADENVGEAQQALDSNCQERSCVSCGAGKLRVKTVTYTKTYFPGSSTYLCSAPTTTTYGTCGTTCSL